MLSTAVNLHANFHCNFFFSSSSSNRKEEEEKAIARQDKEQREVDLVGIVCDCGPVFFFLCVYTFICSWSWQTLNMVDVVIRSVRIFKVQKSGDLHDKLAKDVSLLCEHCPQGISIKVYEGMCSNYD